MRSITLGGAAMATIAGAVLLPAGADAQRKPPYYVSVSAGEANMRTGPGTEFPASWVYRRADLPVKVVAIHKNWRKVEDPDGTQGWMQVTLLSERRTAIIVDDVTELREEPSASSAVLWRVEPGVVGRISRCTRIWCKLDVRGRGGFVTRARLWGVGRDEMPG